MVGTLIAGTCFAAPVWESTFDASADGVVDIFDNNLGKVMIGANNGGTQTITASDNLTNAYTPDKAGREIVGGVTGADAFSALYKFSWSSLYENAVEFQEQYEAFGFLGNASPQTRQIMGGILRHWKDAGDYYIGLDLAVGSVGATNFGYKGGSAVNLGPNALGTDYQLTISYDPNSATLSVSMYDAGGGLLGSTSGVLEFGDVIPPPFGTAAAEIGAFQATHLGWSDYTAYATDGAAVWEVDSLAYYDTAGGADADAVPEPTALTLLGLGAAAMMRRKVSA
jgi:hypothetical protein